MKRGLLGFSLLILLTQVISAQFYSGYGGFSLTNFFSKIDPTTIIFGLLFLIFFALIFYALSRIFKDPYGQPNKGIAGTIAFAVTSLIIYGLYRTGFNFEGIFYNFGLSIDSLYPILGVLFLIVAVLLIWGLGRTKDEFGKKTFSLRRGVGGFFMLFGLFLILLTIFTEIFYEKLTTLIIGIVLLVIGLVLWRRRKKKVTGYDDYSLRKPGWFSRRREKRREFGDIRYGQRMDYKRQKTEQKYQRKLREEEVKRQARAIGRGAGRARGGIAKYDWKKEKRQARAIRKGIAAAGRGIGRGVGDVGRGVGDVGRGVGRGVGDIGRDIGRGAGRVGRGIGRKKLRRAEKAAYKEEAKRQKRMERQRKGQQAQEQIQQINNEIARLQQMIPSASVIERGKIEDQIRVLLKRAKKLR